VLSGDGSLIALPYVARTGDAEYLLWDPTERGAALSAWLSFLAGIEQQGVRAFDNVAVEDVSGSLHPLLLCGAQAPAVLADYLAEGEACPAAGTVCAVSLDRMQALVAGVPLANLTCYLMLVPPQQVRVLWRSLLSFASVEPMGSEGLDRLVGRRLPWHRRMAEPGQLAPSRAELEDWGVLHAPDGFVGVRGLAG
jgi:aminomethyltransferase